MTVREWLDRIPEADECLPYPFSVGSHGYGQFSDGSRKFLAHRYICTKFHGPSRGRHAAHSCGDKLCVNPRHIRWASRSENEKDKRLHGRDNGGTRHGLAKLTENEVAAIRSASGLHKDIAAVYGIARQTVGDIKGRRRWAHLS